MTGFAPKCPSTTEARRPGATSACGVPSTSSDTPTRASWGIGSESESEFVLQRNGAGQLCLTVSWWDAWDEFGRRVTVAVPGACWTLPPLVGASSSPAGRSG